MISSVKKRHPAALAFADKPLLTSRSIVLATASHRGRAGDWASQVVKWSGEGRSEWSEAVVFTGRRVEWQHWYYPIYSVVRDELATPHQLACLCRATRATHHHQHHALYSLTARSLTLYSASAILCILSRLTPPPGENSKYPHLTAPSPSPRCQEVLRTDLYNRVHNGQVCTSTSWKWSLVRCCCFNREDFFLFGYWFTGHNWESLDWNNLNEWNLNDWILRTARKEWKKLVKSRVTRRLHEI